eukprot:366389-Chlamydomonas_euryale.AAC.7
MVVLQVKRVQLRACKNVLDAVWRLKLAMRRDQRPQLRNCLQIFKLFKLILADVERVQVGYALQMAYFPQALGIRTRNIIARDARLYAQASQLGKVRQAFERLERVALQEKRLEASVFLQAVDPRKALEVQMSRRTCFVMSAMAVPRASEPRPRHADEVRWRTQGVLLLMVTAQSRRGAAAAPGSCIGQSACTQACSTHTSPNKVCETTRFACQPDAALTSETVNAGLVKKRIRRGTCNLPQIQP